MKFYSNASYFLILESNQNGQNDQFIILDKYKENALFVKCAKSITKYQALYYTFLCFPSFSLL